MSRKNFKSDFEKLSDTKYNKSFETRLTKTAIRAVDKQDPNELTNIKKKKKRKRRRPRRRFKRHPLQVRHKQDWGRGFILLLPQAATLPGLDAGSDSVKSASSFVIQNRQTSCSM